MPQIQSGQVVPGVDGAPKLYGTEKTENAIPFQERLMRKFKPQEFVTVKNITQEPCYWQYMPTDNEVESFSEDGMQRIVNRKAPEMWVISPGEVEVLVGASAYRALDVMYKNYMASTTLQKFADPTSPLFNEKNQHLPKNFNYSDGGAQDLFIEKAFLGKAMPTFTNVAPAAPVAPQPQYAGHDSFETQAVPEVAPVATVEDPTIPKPKTTEGAPLGTVEYADPTKPARTAKEVVSGGAKTK